VGSTDFKSDGSGPAVGTVGSTPSRSRHITVDSAIIFRKNKMDRRWRAEVISSYLIQKWIPMPANDLQ